MYRRTHLAVWALTLLSCLFALGVCAQEEPAFDPEMPPVVVKTFPAAGAKDVEAGLKEIRVTFDRPMQTENAWSWIIQRRLGVYPGVRGGPPPRWENGGRTCVLPVSLKPGVLYAVGVNSFRHTGFKGRAGKVAVPFVWVFKTAAAT